MSNNKNKINKKDKVNILEFQNKYYIIKNGIKLFRNVVLRMNNFFYFKKIR